MLIKLIDTPTGYILKRKEEILVPFLAKQYTKRKWLRDYFSANQLTAYRGLLLPALYLGLVFSSDWHISMIFVINLCLLFDFFDGPVARATHDESDKGAFLDPLFDKLLLLPLVWDKFLYTDPILVAILTPVEISLLIIRIYKLNKKIPIKSNNWGKTKMTLESAVIIGLMLSWVTLAYVLLYGALFFSFLSLGGQIKNNSSIKTN